MLAKSVRRRARPLQQPHWSQQPTRRGTRSTPRRGHATRFQRSNAPKRSRDNDPIANRFRPRLLLVSSNHFFWTQNAGRSPEYPLISRYLFGCFDYHFLRQG